MNRADRSQHKSDRIHAWIMASRKRSQERYQQSLRAFRHSGSGFRMWWLKLLGAMSIVTVTIRNGGSTARRRRQVASWGSTATRLSSINESLEPKILLAANILGVSPGTYTDVPGTATDSAITNGDMPTLSGTKDTSEVVTLTYTDASAMLRTDTDNSVGVGWTIVLSNGILSGTEVSASTFGVTDDAVQITLDMTAPNKPTSVSVSAVGGTVKSNTLHSTNTHLVGSASISAGHAVGGKAELYVGSTPVATDSSILATDTKVNFTTADSDPIPVELQGHITSGGLVTVILYDAAGNVSTSIVGNPTLTVDYSVPTVEISDSTVAKTNAAVTYTFEFSEPVVGFTSSDVTVIGGSKGSLTTVNPALYRMVVTPFSNSTANITVALAANVLTDAAGNPNGAAAAAAQEVDTKKPTLAIIDSIIDSPDVAIDGETVTFTFTFSQGASSEDVTGFTVGDIVVTGGTKAATFATGVDGESVYTLEVTPNPNSTSPITVKVAAGAAIDAVGNPNTAAGPVSQAVDTKVPTVTITDNKSGVTNGPVTYTFTFSEVVTGLTVADIDVTGDATMGILTPSPGGKIYTLVVTPLTASDTPITVQVLLNGASDAAGNGNIASALSTQTVDTQAPTVEISDSTVAKTNAAVTYTFEFSEPVVGFTSSDVTVIGGSKGSLTTVNPALYRMVVTPFSNSTANITVALAANVLTDAAGNPNGAAAAAAQEVDTKKPTLAIIDSIIDSPDVAIDGETVTFTFTFSQGASSEDVTGFTVGDIVVTGGTKAATFATGVDGESVYTLEVTPNPNSTSPITVKVAAGAAIDAVGNPNTAAGPVSQAVDTKVPTVTITDNKSGVTNGPVTYTFTFSEVVTGLTVADIDVTGDATMGILTPSPGGKIYTLVVTPLTASDTPITVQVLLNGASDAAGNGNIASALSTQTVDTQAPTVIIFFESAQGSLNSDEEINVGTGKVTYTFTFDEPVHGFTASDVAVVNGTKGTLTSLPGGNIYSLVVTPKPNFEGNLTVSLAAGVATDAAGNGNTVATTNTLAMKTVVPTLVITDNVSGTAVIATNDVTFTFTFSEDVGTSFVVSDVGVTNGTKGACVRVNATTYTLKVTPLPNFSGTMKVRVNAFSFANLAENENNVFTELSQLVNTLI